MTNTAVVIPSTVTLYTRGGAYALQGVHAKFSKNGVNVCICVLAVGRNEQDSSVNVGFERGDEASITVSNATPVNTGGSTEYLYLTSGSFTLFNGVIDDFGPAAIDFGRYSVQVVIRGEAAYLASGTFGSSGVISKSYLDTNVSPIFGQASEDLGQMNIVAASNDLWGELSRVLIRTATATPPVKESVTKFIIEEFGADINDVAASSLSSTDGNLVWNQAVGSGTASGIVMNINQMLPIEWYHESFLNRITSFGEMLRFVVLETNKGIKVVPYHPFFRRADAKEIRPNTYSSIRYKFTPYSLFAGTVLVCGTAQDRGDDDGNSMIVGSYKMLGRPLGMVNVTSVPPYLTVPDTNIITGGDGKRRLLPMSRSVGDRIAKIMTWELNYASKSIEVSCPFLRGDIGPLEAVKVTMPDIPEIQTGGETKAFYGSVQSVSIDIDAANSSASTTYDIGFVRSYQHQKFLIDPDLFAGEHPFFDTNYIGGRLDTGRTRGVSGQESAFPDDLFSDNLGGVLGVG
jgi:hypothetical protein